MKRPHPATKTTQVPAEFIGKGKAEERPDDLLTPEQASALLHAAPSTLATWRCTQRYTLPYIKIGSKVRYERRAIVAFKMARTKLGSAEGA
jgi:hypothetical protein